MDPTKLYSLPKLAYDYNRNGYHYFCLEFGSIFFSEPPLPASRELS